LPQIVISNTDSVLEYSILLFNPARMHKSGALVILSPAPLDSRVKIKLPDREEQSKKAKECANKIKFQREDDTPYPKRQYARAMPNQSLQRIFGIDNGFTNPDRPSKIGFTQKAEKSMLAAMNVDDNNPDGDWVDLRRRALIYFDEYMRLNGTCTIIHNQDE
jgi:hypothetical protein